MRVKILVASTYIEMEAKFKKEMKSFSVLGKKVTEVKVIEKYDMVVDDGFISYHIFYKEA